MFKLFFIIWLDLLIYSIVIPFYFCYGIINDCSTAGSNLTDYVHISSPTAHLSSSDPALSPYTCQFFFTIVNLNVYSHANSLYLNPEMINPQILHQMEQLLLSMCPDPSFYRILSHFPSSFLYWRKLPWTVSLFCDTLSKSLPEVQVHKILISINCNPIKIFYQIN